MPLFPVSPRQQLALQERMRHMGVEERDLDEHFIRSRGPGGQNVNKVSTCVVLRHRPSGIEVRCQQERSQSLNRFLARRALLSRLEAGRLGAVSAEVQRIAKIRRQKRKRSKRAKDKMLFGKKLRAEKKGLRGKVTSDE